VNKHSVSIRGHPTSFSLEDDFWRELKQIAAEQNISISRLVTRIDAKRAPDENLSSALRLYILRTLKSRLPQD